MNEDLPNPKPDPLPQLAAVFRGIKSGHHWCFGDPEYADLSGELFEDYKAFFAQLELNLHRDSRGFIYAVSDDEDYRGTDQITRFVVFTAIWVDAVADTGADIGKALFQPNQSVVDLPHLHAEAHRRILALVGINETNDIVTLLRAMERLGLLSLDGQERFSLRAAFHRLLDVCLDAKMKNSPLTPDDSSMPDDSELAGAEEGEAS